MSPTTPKRLLRFASFEIDLTQEELRRGGVLVKLQAQPLKVLALLAEHSGDLVSREEIQRHVWGLDTFVDYEQGINVCIRQIRQALGDSASSPRFVETVPRRGYRFLAPVEVESGNGHPREAASSPAATARPAPNRHRFGRRLAAVATALAAGALGATLWIGRQPAAAPTAGTEVLQQPMMLVLPFHNLGASPTEDYLGDGLTEELITELSRRYGGRLGVIARTTSMKYKQTHQGIADIAADLGVSYVLEGSVRRSGERLRVTAQLIRAADEVHLWAGNYDRDLGDLLELQSEVSERIGQALALALELVPPQQPPEMAATVPAAYEAFLEGRYLLRRPRAAADPDAGEQSAGQSLERARRAFERAVALDPGFAPAYLGLAGAYQRLPLPPRETMPRVRAALDQALSLDDAIPEAHLRLAKLRFYYDWDLEGARESFERALELSPAYAEAYHDFAAYFSASGRHEEAIASVERALRLDPLAPDVASDVGWYSYFARRWDDAIERCEKTLDIAPDFFWARECILLSALAKGDLETALMRARADLEGEDVTAAEWAAVAAAEPAEALSGYFRLRLARLQQARARRYVSPTFFATLHMALGEREAALADLEEAVEQRSGWILPFLAVHPLFDPLRDDPRFRELVARIRG